MLVGLLRIPVDEFVYGELLNLFTTVDYIRASF